MSNVQAVIKQGGQAAAAVLSGFGGFLLSVQPPQGVLRAFTIGFSSTLSALLFIVISILSRRYASERYRGIFIVLAMVLVAIVGIAGFRYQSMFTQLTLNLPSTKGFERIIIGTVLTPEASNALAKSQEPISQLVLDFGGEDAKERVWTRASIEMATLKLNDGYIFFAVSIAAAIFCISESLFPTKSLAR